MLRLRLVFIVNGPLLFFQFALFQFLLCPHGEGKVEKCKVVLFIELPYLIHLLHYLLY